MHKTSCVPARKRTGKFALLGGILAVGVLALVSGCGQTGDQSSSERNAVSNATTNATANAQANSTGNATVNSTNGVGSGDSSGTNTTDNAGASTPASNGQIQFADYMANVMQYVGQQTKMPLFAPTLPTFQPGAPAVSALVFRSATNYSVDLYATPSRLPVNDPSLTSNGTYTEIANFDGESYTTSAQATQAFEQTAAAFVVNRQQGGTEENLGNGITGLMYPYQADNVPANYSVIEWHEGKWTIDVFGVASLDLVADAQRVVSYLHTNFLPMTTGVMQVNPPGVNGPSASLTWIFGRNVYMCSTRDSLSAMQLAVSMREYPTYRVIP